MKVMIVTYCLIESHLKLLSNLLSNVYDVLQYNNMCLKEIPSILLLLFLLSSKISFQLSRRSRCAKVFPLKYKHDETKYLKKKIIKNAAALMAFKNFKLRRCLLLNTINNMYMI